MPDIEFMGYSEAEREKLIDTISPHLKDVDFAEYIVFIRNSNVTSSVTELVSGQSVPFVRVSTREEKRAKKITELLTPYCDVETIRISTFEPKTG